jgi:hypothetical protein
VRTKALLDDIALAIDEVERELGDEAVLGTRAPAVSAWSVGEQLQHIARADALCLGAVSSILAGTDERVVAKGRPTMIARLILRAGVIPRGKGDAPSSTVPAPGVERDALVRDLGAIRERLHALARRRDDIAAATLRFPHPILGVFSAHDWLRFTAVHTRHHLAIVRDIRAAS